MKHFFIIISVVQFVMACNTSNPNATPAVDKSLPQGANKVADSIDAESDSYTDSVDFKDAEKNSTQQKGK